MRIGVFTAVAYVVLWLAPIPVRAAARQDLAPCSDERLGPGAECGTLEVPEDRKQPQGRSIDLRVVVLRATGPDPAEPLFLFAGGPGQGATDLAGLALGPFAPVREVRDIVLVDQRGTGGSNPLDCPRDFIADPQAAFGSLFDPPGLRECRHRLETEADLSLYTTSHVADDIDAVRDWLGYDRVVLWGGSGGTRTALVYMREHPTHVLAALLDGVTPTNFRGPSGFARAAQNALDRVTLDCRQQPSCREAFPELAASFEQLLARFDAGPIEATIRKPDGSEASISMQRGDFAYAIRGMLYRAPTIAGLPALIHEAAVTGDLSPFAQAHWERMVALWPVVAMGVHIGIYCAEDVPFMEDDQIEELTRGTFLGTWLIEQYRDACAVWTDHQVDAVFLEPVKSSAPVLLISGYYDPSTPASYADEAARTLPNSRRVVVRNEGHGAEFGCARQLAIDFLTRASLENLDGACENAGPVLFEVPKPAPE